MCGPVVGVSNDEHAAEALLTLASPAEFPPEDQQYVDAFDGSSLLVHIDHNEHITLNSPCSLHRDPNRFYCPFPGCKRSFAELWRLKVHYRAPPNVRGSGRERGHGLRLTHCPKCNTALKVGGHHVKCPGAAPPANLNSNSSGTKCHMIVKKLPNKRRADVLLGPAAVRQGSDPSAASVKQQQQQQCSGAMTEATAITGRSNQHWQQQQQRGADCFAGATASNTEQLLLLQQLVQHMLQQQCLQPLQALPHNSNSNHPAVGEGSMDEQQASHLRQLLAKVDQDLDYVGAEGSAAAGAAAAVDAGTDIVLGDRVVSQLQGALGAGPPLQDSAQTRLVAGSLPLAQSSTSFMDGKLSSEIWHNKTGSSEGSSSSSLAIGDAGGVQLDSDDLAPNSSKHMHGQQQQQQQRSQQPIPRTADEQQQPGSSSMSSGQCFNSNISHVQPWHLHPPERIQPSTAAEDRDVIGHGAPEASAACGHANGDGVSVSCVDTAAAAAGCSVGEVHSLLHAVLTALCGNAAMTATAVASRCRPPDNSSVASPAAAAAAAALRTAQAAGHELMSSEVPRAQLVQDRLQGEQQQQQQGVAGSSAGVAGASGWQHSPDDLSAEGDQCGELGAAAVGIDEAALLLLLQQRSRQ